MWSATFSNLLHPCVVTDVMLVVGVDMLSDVMIVVGVDMFPGIEVIVKATAAIALGFVVAVAYAGVLTAVLLDVVSVINVDMLVDENASGLAAVTTP